MEVVTILAMGFVCIACFMIGAKVGQQTANGEKVELPTVNPMEAYREREAKKEAKKEQDKMDTIMRNIEAYDGTGNGQEEVR